MTADTLTLSHEELREFARTVRKDVLLMTNYAKSGHAGGPFSMADYCAVLVNNFLRIRPLEPFWENRDRFIVSNGHCSAMNYALLSRRGFFSPGYLLTFRSTPSRLQGHPNHIKLPGIEIGTGSLGQGLSVAHGMALGAQLNGQDEVRIVCNIGDGEMQEGQIWEAIAHAGHRGTDNLIMAIDWNDAQIDGTVREVKRMDPVDAKLDSFHWHVRWCDGHDYDDITAAWQWAWDNKGSGKPSAIIFKTLMMKGCPSVEDDFRWHGKAPSDEDALRFLKELGYEHTTLEEARAEYGEPTYDGVVPHVLGASWARVLHMDTLHITTGDHNAEH
jgi:transketolase